MRQILLVLLLLFLRVSAASADEARPDIKLETTLELRAYTGDRAEARIEIKATKDFSPEMSAVFQPRIQMDLARFSETVSTQRGSQQLEILLHQAYLRWHKGPWDMRLGQQVFELGGIDRISPLNVWQPRDFRDPLVDDFLGSPALSIRYSGAIDVLFIVCPTQPTSRPPILGTMLEGNRPEGASYALELARSFGKVDGKLILMNHVDPFPAPNAIDLGIFHEDYVRETLVGGSLVFPVSGWTATFEAAYHQPERLKDHFISYVFQLERIYTLDANRTLTLDVGYADRLTTQAVSQSPFVFDWPFKQAPYVSAEYTKQDFHGLDTTLALRVIRQAAGDLYVNPEYSRQLSPDRRLTVGLDLTSGGQNTFFGAIPSRGYIKYAVKF